MNPNRGDPYLGDFFDGTADERLEDYQATTGHERDFQDSPFQGWASVPPDPTNWEEGHYENSNFLNWTPAPSLEPIQVNTGSWESPNHSFYPVSIDPWQSASMPSNVASPGPLETHPDDRGLSVRQTPSTDHAKPYQWQLDTVDEVRDLNGLPRRQTGSGSLGGRQTPRGSSAMSSNAHPDNTALQSAHTGSRGSTRGSRAGSRRGGRRGRGY